MYDYRRMPESEPIGDAELMRRVAHGSEDAFALLHRRFAPAVFAIALQSLDRAAAEDIVQDVFLAAWRAADTFDPSRGALRPWLLQIAHFRVLNELRRRSRRPEIESDPDGNVLGTLTARDHGPADAVWQRHRRAILRSAVDELSPAQREALGLVFFDDLTHEQAAAQLGVPLGTAKTRIRAGLQKLRGRLAPQLAALAALTLLLFVGMRYWTQRGVVERYDRALSMVTSSDSVNLRLAPAADVPDELHARYRGRPGSALAIVTFSKFPPAPAGQVYQAWARHGVTWTSLGVAAPDAGGSARLLAEDPALAALPDAVEVTLEPESGSAAPTGRVVAAWTP